MTATSGKRELPIGFVLVMVGLLVQVATAFFWSPGTFIVSAVIGVPCVLVGAFATWRRTRKLARAERGP